MAPCEEINHSLNAAFGHILCDTNKPPQFDLSYESDGSLDASPITCSGDSGGPLVLCDGERIVVIGVVQGGSHPDDLCEKAVTIGYYVDVQHYLSWIRNKIGQGKRPLQNLLTESSNLFMFHLRRRPHFQYLDLTLI